MQQLNKISILETVALMRGTRIRQLSSLRVSKLAVFFSRAILAAENKPWFLEMPINRFQIAVHKKGTRHKSTAQHR